MTQEIRNGYMPHGSREAQNRPDNSYASQTSGGKGATMQFARDSAQGARREFDFAGARRKREGRSGDTGRIRSRGRAKIGEVRKEAGRRRRLVEKRRGILLALGVIAMFVLTLLLIYKLLFVVNDITVVGEGIYSAEELVNASGVSVGENLYSFRASSVEKSVTFNCPYIKDVELDRQMPDKVTLSVSEDKPVYYAIVFGEYKLLSEGLRVLESVSSPEELPEGLIRLRLPALAYSVEGRVIKFVNEKRERGIREVLAVTLESVLVEKITTIDLRDQFDITMVCEGKTKLVIGDSERLSHKLKTASKVLEDDMFKTENKIRVDLTTEGKTGVIIDNLMELE